MTTARIDSRAWLAWGLAAMLPPLLGRNPWLLLETLAVVGVVRLAWVQPDQGARMGWFLRIAMVFIAIGVLFNVLTVHAGTSVIATLPAGWPIMGGDLTANALAYGVVSGVALFSLVLTGITVATLVRWVDLFHALPPRLATVAVTGSVAWSFLPRMAESWTHIREAHALRGHRVRRGREVLPLVTPLLGSSLERALVMAEVLEARGFGAVPDSAQSAPKPWSRVILAAGLVMLAAGAYGLAVGLPGWGLVAVGAGLAATLAGARGGGATARRTRLRPTTWQPADSVTVAGAAIAAAVVIAWSVADPESLAWSTYPELSWPGANLVALAAMGLLLTPAFLTRPGTTQE
jgi:energy-coupling factor transport system permease protein